MAGPGELIVNVTCGSRRLQTVAVANTIPFPKFKHLVSLRVTASCFWLCYKAVPLNGPHTEVVAKQC